MPFYVKDPNGATIREKRIVSILSEMISSISGAWEIKASTILSGLGYPKEADLILVQREGKPNEVKLKVLKFIGYTHQGENDEWWAPLAIQGLDEENNLVHCFVYIVSEYPTFFANSGSYGPDIWPDALRAICQKILHDVGKHQSLGGNSECIGK